MLDISLFHLFDNADADGYYTGIVSPHMTQHFAKELLSAKTDARNKRLLTLHLMNMRPFTFIFDRVKVALKQREVSATRDDNGQWILRFNLAKLLMLPAQSPAAELAELRRFFEAIRAFIEEKVPLRAAVQLGNYRDSNGRVYGELHAAAWSDDAPDGDESTDQAMTKQLKELVAASPTLQAFVRNSALSLQKIGPWSWNTFDEHLLFGRDNGPLHTHRMAAVRARLAQDA